MGRTLPFPLPGPALRADPEAPCASAAPLTPEGLFRAYSGYAAAIALRLLGRDEEIEDVVQDVFTAALRDLPRLRSHAAPAVKSWLATITVHIAWRRLRARRLRALLGLDRTPSYEHVIAPEISPEDRALLAQIYTCLDELPTRDRVAWTLRHVEGQPLDEVARLCGCSLATAKRRILAANQALQRRLTGCGRP